MKKFTDSHEWIDLQGSGGIATIGVTDHAQHELGDIVFVELPKVGKEISAGQPAAVLESTKAAADVYAPVAGTIVEVNQALSEQSDLINKAPEREGWIFKLKVNDPADLEKLMDESAYLSSLK
jgi:glycine cleavage system H protein